MFNYLVVNSFSLMILALIFVNLQKNPVKMSFDYRIFFALVLSTALMIVLDTFMVIADNRPGRFIEIFITVSTLLYYIINPLPCLLWTVYALYYIEDDENKIIKMVPALSIPFIINTVAAVFSLFSNILFDIDVNNTYHRGRFFFILVIVCFGYLAYTFIYILNHRKYIDKKNFKPMIWFAIPPIIGGIIQTRYYGTTTLWASVTFSILFIYTNMQNLQIQTDYLTGLYNRRQFDRNLQYRISHRKPKYMLAGLMIDLNNFKAINDIYGHNIGDMALEDTAEVLKQSFKKDDFISRYGGDEFAVILNIKAKNDLSNIINNLIQNIESFNDLKKYPFKLSLSIGSGIYDDNPKDSMEDFIQKIDSKMYIEKKKQKSDDWPISERGNK